MAKSIQCINIAKAFFFHAFGRRQSSYRTLFLSYLPRCQNKYKYISRHRKKTPQEMWKLVETDSETSTVKINVSFSLWATNITLKNKLRKLPWTRRMECIK